MEGNYIAKGWTKTDYETSLQVLEDMSYDCFHIPRDVLRQRPMVPSMVVDYRDLVSQPKATIEKLYQTFSIDMPPEYAALLDERDQEAREHQTSHKYTAKEFGMDVAKMQAELSEFYEQYQWPRPEPEPET